MRGQFISLEGIDGSGKSTQAVRLADALRERGHEVELLREPGGTPLGEAIRALLLSANAGAATPCDEAEALLYAASRAQLVHDVIRPALERGTWIVCDRFVDSSLAYQGAFRALGIDAVRQANALAVGDVMPDITVYIQIDPAVAAERMARRAADNNVVLDRLEQEGAALLTATAAAFDALAREGHERFITVDGAGDEGSVFAAMMAAVEQRLAVVST